MKLIAAMFVAAASLSAAPPADVPALLARMGERIEDYFARAQSIVCTEVVVIEPVSTNFLSESGRARQLEYELRVSWDAGDGTRPPDVKQIRELIRVDGRPPRANDEPECIGPDAVATEPLAMLLPGRQQENAFTWRGVQTIERRASVMLDYLPLQRGAADVQFEENCVRVELPGRSRGRLWVDASSGDVLRLDSQMVGTFEFDVPQRFQKRGAQSTMVLERADSSIRYQPVTFRDPDESVILPATIRSTTVFRNSPSPRVRVTQTFSNYRRFITGGRVVRPE